MLSLTRILLLFVSFNVLNAHPLKKIEVEGQKSDIYEWPQHPNTALLAQKFANQYFRLILQIARQKLKSPLFANLIWEQFGLPPLMSIAQRCNSSITDRQAMLECAVNQKQPDWIGPLCNIGANPNGRFPNGHSYLFRALGQQYDANKATVEALLDSGAKIDGLCWDGWDLLEAAVEAGDTDKARQLRNGYKEVHWNRSITWADWESLHVMIGYERVSVEEPTLLWFAIFRRLYPDMVKLLINRGANPREIDPWTGSSLSQFALDGRNYATHKVLQEAIKELEEGERESRKLETFDELQIA